MITTPEDIAVNTLLAVAKERFPDLTPDLVKRIYEIQKRYQFDRDDVLPAQAMQRVLEEFVDAQGATI